jgi:hypothetical protein
VFGDRQPSPNIQTADLHTAGPVNLRGGGGRVGGYCILNAQFPKFLGPAGGLILSPSLFLKQGCAGYKLKRLNMSGKLFFK